MKLYYFKDPGGNFGDDLNPWLWEKLLPSFFDADDNELFVGIGTLVNHRIPTNPLKYVFGSGVGYGDLPLLDSKWIFHAVRGFESARLLGLGPEKVITDAAILVQAVEYPVAGRKDKPFGFMPHCQSSRYYDWESICSECGLHYISAEWNVERVFKELTRCEIVICEAMHGAIVADSLRIPWIPVACYDYISAFKWRDWLSTLDLPYAPRHIKSLYDVERNNSPIGRTKNNVKRAMKAVGVWSQNWTPLPPKKSGDLEREQAIRDLREAKSSSSFLSSDRILESHLSRYLDLLEMIRRNPKMV